MKLFEIFKKKKAKNKEDVKKSDEEIFNEFWNTLVPKNGVPDSAQGQAILIAGTINKEIWENNSSNWDDKHRKMLRLFPRYLEMGNAFDKEDVESAEILVNLLQDGHDVLDTVNNKGKLCEVLCSCAATWVQINPDKLPPLEDDCFGENDEEEE